MFVNERQRLRRNASKPTQKSLVSVLLVGSLCLIVGFYVGLMVGSGVRSAATPSAATSELEMQARIQAEVQKRLKVYQKVQNKAEDTDPRFPSTVSRVAFGASVVNRDDFGKAFDVGVPFDASSKFNEEVLILYSNEDALPSDPIIRGQSKSMTTLPSINVQEATENCEHLHIALTQPSPKRKQCVALFGQYEAYHLQKFLRLPESGPVDLATPLRFVARGVQDNGRISLPPPTATQTREYWGVLKNYLENIDAALESLDKIAKDVAVKNTIIVLICNQGQSELLANFVCSARNRNMDLSGVLVFATDEETRDIAKAFGVPVFYNEEIFGGIPKKAAKQYGDKTFARIMMGKVFCVHMTNMLGYDVLFQDVDVIWYKQPLDFFHDESNPIAGFDAYFQDDGNHALYYAPYSANTGFYYIRNNERTRYFFNAFLVSGDLILSSHSHQIALVALLQEHTSMYGLKVKILSRDDDDFPGGYTFHNRKPYMRSMIDGQVEPYIFHMSWTANKNNKQAFYEQMGEWFLKEQCVGKAVDEIFPNGKGDIQQECCSADPLLKCHYKDKPSRIPCKDSPVIDSGGRSFW